MRSARRAGFMHVPIERAPTRNPGENPNAPALAALNPRAHAHTPAVCVPPPLMMHGTVPLGTIFLRSRPSSDPGSSNRRAAARRRAGTSTSRHRRAGTSIPACRCQPPSHPDSKPARRCRPDRQAGIDERALTRGYRRAGSSIPARRCQPATTRQLFVGGGVQAEGP